MMHRLHSNMIDPRCGPIKRLTKDMREGKANAWFCQKSEDAKKVFKDEQSWVETSSGLHDTCTKSKCKEFNKKYTMETMEEW
jgi:hypothetical protein